MSFYRQNTPCMSHRILFVEDDKNLGFVTKDNLEEEGFTVDLAVDGEQALELFKENYYELSLLDVMMPKMDGFSVAKKIREKNEFIPILFLTARSQEEDRLKGFEIGGDDYISKPFSMKELVYRINVFLRRSFSGGGVKTPDPINVGNYLFDPQNHLLRIEEKVISLTQMETSLIRLLVENKDELVTREQILMMIWGENDYFKGRSLDVFISRLRKYFREDPGIEIRNHHGVGFKLSVYTDR